MLKSIGISPKGLSKMLLIESICYSIKPLLYGTPLVVGFGLYLLYMLRISWQYIFTIFPYDYFAITGIGLSGGVFLITYLLMRKIKKETIIDSIKENIH